MDAGRCYQRGNIMLSILLAALAIIVILYCSFDA
jgi:hypothetical protein